MLCALVRMLYFSVGKKKMTALVQSFTRPIEFDGLPHSVLVTVVVFLYSYSTDENRKGKRPIQGHVARELPSQAEIWRPSPVLFGSTTDYCFMQSVFQVFVYFVVFKDQHLGLFFPSFGQQCSQFSCSHVYPATSALSLLCLRQKLCPSRSHIWNTPGPNTPHIETVMHFRPKCFWCKEKQWSCWPC